MIELVYFQLLTSEPNTNFKYPNLQEIIKQNYKKKT